MGQGMASNLAKAGAKVVVWNRSEGKRKAFVAAHPGCSAVATPKEVVEACDLSYLMLSDLEASKCVTRITGTSTWHRYLFRKSGG